VTIPAEQTVTLLLDQGEIVNAYPCLSVSGGNGATIELAYQEALMANADDVFSKGHRDDIEGKAMHAFGQRDRFRIDGREQVTLEPLSWRSWRFLELRITTSDEPLTLNQAGLHITGYPFDFQAKFESDAWFDELVPLAERTLRLAADETWMDAPFYERMQYTSDTWLQMLTAFVLSDDDRLARRSIADFHDSIRPDGWVMSRYPTRIPQLIPSVTPACISMLRDFARWRGDLEFVSTHIDLAKSILRAFYECRDNEGIVGRLPRWSFVDWVDHDGWFMGEPPGAQTGDSLLISQMYLLGLEEASEVYTLLGEAEEAARSAALAQKLKQQLVQRMWQPETQLFSDTKQGTHFSRHAQTLAVLTHMHEGLCDGAELLHRMQTDERCAPMSFYFQSLMFDAMHQVGRGDLIWPALKPWRGLLEIGLSTFPETPEPTRSDCHAWSCHILYHFFASVIGLRPTAPGCATMQLTPPPVSDLLPTRLAGTMITPRGPLGVSMQKAHGHWDITVDAPEHVEVHIHQDG